MTIRMQRVSEDKMVQLAGTWLKDDRVGVFTYPDGIRPVIFFLGGGITNAKGRWKDSMPLGEPG